MQGKTHATMGLAAGLWTPTAASWVVKTFPFASAGGFLPRIAGITGPVEGACFGLTAAAFAIVPDWDTGKSLGTTMWGPVSRALTAPVRWVFDHRKGTHNPLLAPLVFAVLVIPQVSATLIAWASSVLLWVVSGFAPVAAANFAPFWTDAEQITPFVAAFTVAVTVGLALAGLGASFPGPWRWWPVNLTVSCAAGVAALTVGVVPLWLPVAAGLGVLVHIVGDAINSAGLTYGGVGEGVVHVGMIVAAVAWVDMQTGLGIIPGFMDAAGAMLRALLA